MLQGVPFILYEKSVLRFIRKCQVSVAGALLKPALQRCSEFHDWTTRHRPQPQNFPAFFSGHLKSLEKWCRNVKTAVCSPNCWFSSKKKPKDLGPRAVEGRRPCWVQGNFCISFQAFFTRSRSKGVNPWGLEPVLQTTTWRWLDTDHMVGHVSDS